MNLLCRHKRQLKIHRVSVLVDLQQAIYKMYYNHKNIVFS